MYIVCACSVAQSCPTLCSPMDYSLSGFFVHGIFQARILEWVAIPYSRGSSQPQRLNPFLLCSIHYIERKECLWCIITQLLHLSYILCSIPCKFLPFWKTHYNLVCHYSCFRVTNVNIVSFKELIFGHQGVMF